MVFKCCPLLEFPTAREGLVAGTSWWMISMTLVARKEERRKESGNRSWVMRKRRAVERDSW